MNSKFSCSGEKINVFEKQIAIQKPFPTQVVWDEEEEEEEEEIMS